MRYLVVLTLFIIALWLNPKELYYSHQGEQQVLAVTYSLLEAIGHDDEEIIAVLYQGGNIYLLVTDANRYMIERTRPSRSLYEFNIFNGNDLTIGRFSGY